MTDKPANATEALRELVACVDYETLSITNVPRFRHALFSARAVLAEPPNIAAHAALWQHDRDCKTDTYSRDVCEGMYGDKCDDVNELCDALKAIATLCGGHDDQSRRIVTIAETAIREHGGPNNVD